MRRFCNYKEIVRRAAALGKEVPEHGTTDTNEDSQFVKITLFILANDCKEATKYI